MLNTPCFKPDYSVITYQSEHVFILSERESVCLSDRTLSQVAALIDGQRSSDDIIEAIQLTSLDPQASKLNQAELFQHILNTSIKAQAALFQLAKDGYITEKPDPMPSHMSTHMRAMCHHLDVDPEQAHRRLQASTIAIQSFDGIDPEMWGDALEAIGIQVVREHGEATDPQTIDLTIALTQDYLNPALDEWNQKALHSRTPWLLVKPTGTMIWIGPLFNPDQSTACWHCLAPRLRDNRPIESFLKRQDPHADVPVAVPGVLPSTLQTALGLTTTEIFKWIVQGKQTPLTNRLITYDTLTLDHQEHAVVKRPQCQSCREIPQTLNRQPLPVVLGHRQKTFTADGGHRVCSPQETLHKYSHHLSPITGVVRELAKVPGNPLNHTYVARHHFVTMFDDLSSLHKNLSGRSAGKGRTDAQARASGFCEAIERYSGVFQGDELRVKGSYHSIGEQAIHPNACMNFSPHQYETRTEWNAQCHGWFQKVPEPFDEEREIEWTPVWSLTHQTFKYLPTAYCYYGYPPSDTPDCWADSNGCAAGNTIEEAILQGLMEVVERDSIALWWYNRLRKPQVDLDSFDEPYFDQVKQYYRQLGRTLWVLDITSDLNIPTFAAVSAKVDSPVEDIILGYGAHLDAKLALGRALTEINQLLPSVLPSQNDGSTQYPQHADSLAIKWWKTATLATHSYLSPDDHRPKKTWTDYPQLTSDDLLNDVNICQKVIEERNMELLVLDQTRADIGLRVVKVMVPGMRHMWKRLGAGRLYDIPSQIGWLNKPLNESQVNPFPMWM